MLYWYLVILMMVRCVSRKITKVFHVCIIARVCTCRVATKNHVFLPRLREKLYKWKNIFRNAISYFSRGSKRFHRTSEMFEYNNNDNIYLRDIIIYARDENMKYWDLWLVTRSIIVIILLLNYAEENQSSR